MLSLLYMTFHLMVTDSVPAKPANIVEFPLKSRVELFSVRNRYEFSKSPFGFNTRDYSGLRPKNELYVGVYGQYRWIGLAYSRNVYGRKKDANGNEIKATTMGLSAIGDKWGGIGTFHSYRGLAMVNRRNEKEVIYPNLKFRELAVSIYHVLNGEDFSMRAAISYSAQQIRSAGSFFIWLQLNGQQWNALPSLQQDSVSIPIVKDDAPWKNVISAVPQLGYGYNVIFGTKGWGASILIHTGVGPAVLWSEHEPRQFKASWALGAAAQVGYNGPKWYTYLHADENCQSRIGFTNQSLYMVMQNVLLTIGLRL